MRGTNWKPAISVSVALGLAGWLAAGNARAELRVTRAGLSGKPTGAAEAGFVAKPEQTMYVHLDIKGADSPASIYVRIERGDSILLKRMGAGRIEPGVGHAVATVPLPADAGAGSYKIVVCRENTDIGGCGGVLAHLDFEVALVPGGKLAAPTAIDATMFTMAVENVARRRLTPAERRAISGAVGDANRRGGTINGAQQFAAFGSSSDVRARTAAAATLIQRLEGEGALEPWRTTGPIAVGDRTIIVSGLPPLTRGVLEANVAVLEFGLSLIFADPEYRLPATDRRALEKTLIQRFRQLGPAEKESMQGMPLEWLKLRTWWAQQPKELQMQLAAGYQQAWLKQQQQAAQEAEQRAWLAQYQQYLAATLAAGSPGMARPARRAPAPFDARREFWRKQNMHNLSMTMNQMTFNSFRYGRPTGFETPFGN
ncbi:MAG: hypothetical protein HY698_13715 [Deltaproteobacteria bacterium]|nr:hypothetical protein [Deltaproteobacteria bacterium]